VDARSRRAVEVSERHADGRASKAELAQAQSAAEAAKEAAWRMSPASPEDQAARAAWTAACWAEAADSGPLEVLVRLVLSQTGAAVWAAGRDAVCALSRRQCGLLRCIFGDPFRPPPALAPALLRWNGGTAVKLAQAAYDDRHLPEGVLDNGRLAVLADALEEAGCDNTEVFAHLRQQGQPHVRGCWVVDLLLEKD
jgi:hypothetical protein